MSSAAPTVWGPGLMLAGIGVFVSLWSLSQGPSMRKALAAAAANLLAGAANVWLSLAVVC